MYHSSRLLVRGGSPSLTFEDTRFTPGDLSTPRWNSLGACPELRLNSWWRFGSLVSSHPETHYLSFLKGCFLYQIQRVHGGQYRPTAGIGRPSAPDAVFDKHLTLKIPLHYGVQRLVYNRSRANTNRLKLSTERCTYCWKCSHPFQVQRSAPKTRLSIEIQPSIPARKRL